MISFVAMRLKVNMEKTADGQEAWRVLFVYVEDISVFIGKKDSQNISQMNSTISQKKSRNMSMTKQSM